MVVIRLKRAGKRNAPFYHIVVADSRFPRDGRFLEKIGYYNPLKKTDQKAEKFTINIERYNYWVSVGAQPSETVSKGFSLQK